MRLTYKYRLYPTRAQADFLDGQLRAACDLYNAAKQERDAAWKIARTSISYYDQANQLKAMRAEHLIGVANFSCCQEILRRVDRAYRAFFVRVQRGERVGFPRYRSARRYDSLTFPSTVGQYIVRIVTDAAASIQELNYSNNTGTAAQSLNDQATYSVTVSTPATSVSIACRTAPTVPAVISERRKISGEFQRSRLAKSSGMASSYRMPVSAG